MGYCISGSCVGPPSIMWDLWSMHSGKSATSNCLAPCRCPSTRHHGLQVCWSFPLRFCAPQFLVAVPLTYPHAHGRYNHMQTKLSGRNNGCRNYTTQPLPTVVPVQRGPMPMYTSEAYPPRSRFRTTSCLTDVPEIRLLQAWFQLPTLRSPPQSLPRIMHRAPCINDQPLMLDRHAYPAGDSIPTWHTELMVARHEWMETNTWTRTAWLASP